MNQNVYSAQGQIEARGRCHTAVDAPHLGASARVDFEIAVERDPDLTIAAKLHVDGLTLDFFPGAPRQTECHVEQDQITDHCSSAIAADLRCLAAFHLQPPLVVALCLNPIAIPAFNGEAAARADDHNRSLTGSNRSLRREISSPPLSWFVAAGFPTILHQVIIRRLPQPHFHAEVVLVHLASLEMGLCCKPFHPVRGVRALQQHELERPLGCQRFDKARHMFSTHLSISASDASARGRLSRLLRPASARDAVC